MNDSMFGSVVCCLLCDAAKLQSSVVFRRCTIRVFNLEFRNKPIVLVHVNAPMRSVNVSIRY